MKNKIINTLKTHTFSFWYLNFLIIALILLPKNNFIFNELPIRLGLITIFMISVIIEKYKNILTFKNTNMKLLVILYSLFILSTIPSLFVTKEVITSIYTIVKFISVFVLFYLIAKINYTKEEKKYLVLSFLIASTIVFFCSTISYILDIGLFKKNLLTYPGMKGRVEFTFFNPCYLGAFICLSFPIFLYKFLEKKNLKENILYSIILGLLFLALLFTFTRSAILVLFGLVCMCLVLFRKKIYKLKMLILVVIIIGLSLLIPGVKSFYYKSFEDGIKVVSKLSSFLPGFIDEEDEKSEYLDYDDNSEFSDYSLQHRESYVRMAKTIGKNNILTGVGFGTYLDYINSDEFNEKYPNYIDELRTPPHSAFVLLYAETGIISLILFSLFNMVIVIQFVIILFKNFKKTDELYYFSSLGLLTIAGFFVINLIAENAFYDTQLAPIFFIMIGYFYNNSVKSIK